MEKLVRLDSQVAPVLKAMSVDLDRKEVKVCKDPEENLANLVSPVKLDLRDLPEKTDFPATREVKENRDRLVRLVSPALAVLLDLLVAPALLVLRAIPVSLELRVLRANKD